MFTMLCINGTTTRPLPVPSPFGCMIFFFFKNPWKQCLLQGWLGARLIHLLGYLPLPLPWCPFPLPRARCSVVYISSPRRGAHAPRDMILSLVLAHGTLYKELGGRSRKREPS
ncbi:hypothetical protein EGK_00681 [Macaca mulatta]|uniref:Uncharacterized protein n=2 Tax=Macaca TaxID=9539 RepID=F7FKJ5_MACMU|nr:hypothetical protein EGK_00681 [Macaca mulatta]EHH49858.1 hypothetical protein EGM_00585 [Macaca fascicularis]